MSPPNGQQDGTGPLGIDNKDNEGWDWNYYFKQGATLNEQQYEIVAMIIRLASILRQLPKTAVSSEIMQRIKGIFSATLVQSFSGDLKRMKDEIDSAEKEIFTRVATPEYRMTLKRPVKLTVLAIAITGALYIAGILLATYTSVGQSLPQLATVNTFFLVAIGCLFGRVIYYGMSFSEKIASIDTYLEKVGEVSHIEMAIFFDVAVGVAACLLFITGLVVIAFGGDPDAATGSVRAAITSLMIKDNPLLALAFGLLVGIAKTEFLMRLGRIGRDRIA
ncbi:hypothetical protein [Neorhizobium alkalisoli]|uniref:Uncharacterized protein n=1 Tax=Neorhizobium alkalisoli TaxID=528178 RepID=A0A561QWK4_9HYPH|nr:hypothetical protein [Neorhizobium alkalisoli]TWF54738.1 hypothetical protein FHW37_103608 [Neorhizobium alkalisoli]